MEIVQTTLETCLALDTKAEYAYMLPYSSEIPLLLFIFQNVVMYARMLIGAQFPRGNLETTQEISTTEWTNKQ